MNVFIENKYHPKINLNYEKIITSVVSEAVDFICCPFACEVNVIITNNHDIRQINKEQRGIDKPTDVLSFPFNEFEKPGDFSGFYEDFTHFNPDTGELVLGDIVLSYDKVISQSEEYNHSQVRELAFLTAHSMLHLFGFDHMTDDERIEMETKQNTILQNLGITREN